MRILEQWSVRFEAGDIIEWQPTPAAAASAADAAPVDVSPTLLQSIHLPAVWERLSQGVPLTSFVGAAADLNGELDESALTEALTRFVRRHDALRIYYQMDDGVVSTRLVSPDVVAFESKTVGSIDDSGWVRLDSGVDAGWEGDIYQYISRRFARDADPFSWPVLGLSVVRRAGSFSVMLCCDHAVSDGVAQALGVDEFFQHYRAAVDGVDTQLPTALTGADSFLEFARTENELAATVPADADIVRELVDVFAENNNVMPSFPADLGLASGEVAPIVGHKRIVFDALGAAEFERICRELGARTLPGLLAAVAITDYETTGRSRYFGVTILNARSDDERGSQGWFVRYAPVCFDMREASTFSDVVALANYAYERGKRLAQAPLATVLGQVMAAPGADVDGLLRPPHMVSYLDFRWFSGAGTTPYDDAFIFSADGDTQNASIWFNRDSRYLYLDSQTPGTPTAQRVVRVYHDHLISLAGQVIDDGDYRIGAAGSPDHLRTMSESLTQPESVYEQMRTFNDPVIARIVERLDRAQVSAARPGDGMW